MSLFTLTPAPERANLILNTDSLMVQSAFPVPPKSLLGEDKNILEPNMNYFNDMVLPNMDSLRSILDQIFKEASQNPSVITDITRTSSVDVGFKQTEKTDSRQTTVEVNISSHTDDVITKRCETETADHCTRNVLDKEDGDVDNNDDVTRSGDDVSEINESKDEVATETKTSQAASEPDPNAKDSALLNLIETVVELQQTYNHLKSNWDHVGNTISQSLNFLPIPGLSLFSKMLGFSDENKKKGSDRKTPDGSPRTYRYLPHGPCQRCAARREKQATEKAKDARHFGNDITNTAKTEKMATGLMTGNTNSRLITCGDGSPHECTNKIPDVNESRCLSDLSSSVTDSDNMAKSHVAQNERHLSKMSKDCANVNRLLLNVVKENMKSKHKKNCKQ